MEHPTHPLFLLPRKGNKEWCGGGAFPVVNEEDLARIGVSRKLTSILFPLALPSRAWFPAAPAQAA